MSIPPDLSDSIELLIIKKTDALKGDIEHLFVKKSDINDLIAAFINVNPYFQGLKYMIAAILMAFSSTMIYVVYSAYAATQG